MGPAAHGVAGPGSGRHVGRWPTVAGRNGLCSGAGRASDDYRCGGGGTPLPLTTEGLSFRKRKTPHSGRFTHLAERVGLNVPTPKPLIYLKNPVRKVYWRVSLELEDCEHVAQGQRHSPAIASTLFYTSDSSTEAPVADRSA